MSRGGSGNMLGVGGTRKHLGRAALRGGGRDGRVGGRLDPRAQKRELLRKLQEQREEQQKQREDREDQEGQDEGDAGQEGRP
ncbi:DUF6243 family protein [Streptomyces sp. NPDC050388]|uniref:DUF6243 family protein n=1 Tax=Streptomyces sp. NPDC050388 TaxID=3155781 RepID=UPI003448AA69